MVKFYKIDKNILKWQEMPQTKAKLRCPLLIDKDYNVLLGNCLKDRSPDKEICIVIEPWPYFLQILPKLEREIFDSENSERWLYAVDKEVCEFLRDEITKVEYIPLFEFKVTDLLTEENYKRGGIYDFKKASIRHKDIIDDQLRLIQFEDDEVIDKKHEEIEIDMEILKELL